MKMDGQQPAAIYYSWNWDDWSDQGRVEIYELTSSRLVCVEKILDEPEVSVLRPVGN